MKRSNAGSRCGMLAALVLLTFTVGGCAVGPDYRGPPPVETGSGWTQPSQSNAADVDLSAWWATLGDPDLTRLVEEALANNLDLQQAHARIDEARALRDRAAGGYVPVVELHGSAMRRRQSENGALPIASIPGIERDQTIYDAGFDAGWEVDLFGRTRRALQSADAAVQATQAEATGMRISIAAEVARSYLYLRGAQRELGVRTRSAAALTLTRELMEKRFELGDAAQADVDAADARVAAAEAGIPGIQAQLRSAALGLGVLLGGPPERELALLETITDAIALNPIPVGLRADILRRRPDVLAAERRLAARTADIGVATAELFPKLSIGASGGFQALDAGNLFESASQTFSVVPLISWRVLDGGRVRAEIRAADARQAQAVLAYKQTVLAALGDAERALGDYRLGQKAVERRSRAVDAARRSYEHAKIRYRSGDISLTEQLAEERMLRDAEDAYARSHTSAAVALIALFKALGGGWEGQPDLQTPAKARAAVDGITPRDTPED
ncbi:efflux transporter outer membrane subunit [Lysobacter sp. A03]|uniref:efflux transporter outer membrane subunit n=1 Tax=Lysobacter sp. A03 TaxID=1199154 RepID=UPI0005B71247|nr:efflux transporter outer membrane subunit [Lysobacter sp. A03]KIQ96558.1 RND efflux system, outer membrane lipoprotein, NodT family [Lysobacter sp. A03]